MQLEGDSVRLNTTNSNGRIASFRTSGSERLFVEWDSVGSKARIRSVEHIEIENTATANKDIDIVASQHLKLRFGTNGTGQLKVMDPTNANAMISVTEGGVVTFVDSAGVYGVKITPHYTSITATSQVDVGNGDDVRGVVKVWADLTTPVPGSLVLQPNSSSGVTVHLYAQYSGGTTTLWASDTDPASGAGTQRQLAIWP